MASSSMRSSLRNREKMIHVSKPHPQAPGETRKGQRAAKAWLRQKTAELKAFIAKAELPSNVTRASFHYVTPEDGTPFWAVGLFTKEDQEPFRTIKADRLDDALADIEGDFVALYRREDLPAAQAELTEASNGSALDGRVFIVN